MLELSIGVIRTHYIVSFGKKQIAYYTTFREELESIDYEPKKCSWLSVRLGGAYLMNLQTM